MSYVKNREKAASLWGMSENDLNKAETQADKMRMKHGLFAGVPLICKGSECPYSKTCPLKVSERTCGGRCPVEIGTIMSRYDMWCRHFGLDTETDYIDDKDVVDASLIRDLVDLEIQIMRAENKLAITSDFMKEVLQVVDKNGEEHYKDEITPEAQFKLTLNDKKYKVLNLLNATRKDRIKQIDLEDNAGMSAVSIFKKINEAMKQDDKAVIDLDDDI